MAWTYLPKTPALWPGTPWQDIDFWNELIRASNQRIEAVNEITGLSFDPLDEIVAGADIQTVSTSILTWLTLFMSYMAYVDWIDPTVNLTKDATKVDLDDYQLCGVGATVGGWQPRFCSVVNAILDAEGWDPMGTAILSGNLIPFTRKLNNSDAPTVDYGPHVEGDIIDGWIFHEWWAVLQALTCYRVAPVVTIGAGDVAWSGYGDSITTVTPAHTATCAEAKSLTQAAYTTPGSGPSFGIQCAQGHIIYQPDAGVGGPESYSGYLERATSDVQIEFTPVTGGTLTAFSNVVKPPFTDTTVIFENFGDDYSEDTVGHSVSSATSPIAFDAEFKDPSTAASDINTVPCPSAGAVPEYSRIGYYLQNIQAVMRLEFPDP